MTTRERYRRILHKQPVDRIPYMEWAIWWDKTIDRWKDEGLPNLDIYDIGEHLGLDGQRQFWISTRREGCPAPEHFGAPILTTMEDYERIKPFLYPDIPFDIDAVKAASERQKKGEIAVWLTFEGFFWFPRTLMGIAEHLMGFYDEPELMHRINSDFCDFLIRTYDKFTEICVPDFMTFGEDMSYNHGPMLSKELFDEFIRPYYNRIMPVIKRNDVQVIIDSDGDITKLIPWFEGTGVDGFLPFERQAGCDLIKIRESHPNLIIIGGYDKMVMPKGEEAMRTEFERLLPVMKQGGYIASVDHQTPPAVDFDTYHIYLKLLREYCQKAVQ